VLTYLTLIDAHVVPVHPLPNTTDVLDVISDARFVSALDVKAGFLNVPVEEASR
jgi:hypothetical protein